jgi:hypothetical protein
MYVMYVGYVRLYHVLLNLITLYVAHRAYVCVSQDSQDIHKQFL